MRKKNTITSDLLSLEVGEVKEYPVMMCTVLRSMASTIGLRFEREYRTFTDRERRIVGVERVK